MVNTNPEVFKCFQSSNTCTHLKRLTIFKHIKLSLHGATPVISQDKDNGKDIMWYQDNVTE